MRFILFQCYSVNLCFVFLFYINEALLMKEGHETVAPRYNGSPIMEIRQLKSPVGTQIVDLQ